MKLSKKLLVLIVCFSLITIPAFTFCDEPEKIEKVIVTGVGIDADKAKQNAIRNAVEQVVGSYISSDTMVKNNTVLKDKVLGYSGGYVKDIKVLSQEKTDDNLGNYILNSLAHFDGNFPCCSSDILRKLFLVTIGLPS